jgi:ubiquinone/menaquinone biosynthesis C-methylase UbiE
MVIGLDPSDDRIREARAKSTEFDNLLFLWSEPERIPWQEDFFTLVVCLSSLERFQGTPEVLREAGRVLAPGGALWILHQATEEDTDQTITPFNQSGASTEGHFQVLQELGYEECADHSRRFVAASSSWGSVLLFSARKPQK